MQIGAPSSMWPVRFEKTVDVQWTMDEGSGPVDAPGSDVTSVAKVLSTTMARSNYGPSPRATVQRDVDVSVSGKKAHVVETLMTIDPAYRKGRGLKVASERLWIVAVQVASDQITAWYVSVPDVQKALWPKVPDLIEQLKVV